jgi:hypothetical protein
VSSSFRSSRQADDGIVVIRGTVLAHPVQRIHRLVDPLEWKLMSPQTLESRGERLERRMTRLEKLPERMAALESQILQFRTEIRDDFSAVRQEIRDVRHDLRTQMLVLHEEVISRIVLIGEGRPSRRVSGRKPPADK